MAKQKKTLKIQIKSATIFYKTLLKFWKASKVESFENKSLVLWLQFLFHFFFK
jgi:hypothetical protein